MKYLSRSQLNFQTRCRKQLTHLCSGNGSRLFVSNIDDASVTVCTSARSLSIAVLMRLCIDGVAGAVLQAAFSCEDCRGLHSALEVLKRARLSLLQLRRPGNHKDGQRASY